ncbi:uncharacterized protein LOC109820713 isoform X2 [Asparagus officinalis]|uniref:uncharacterized protein LOC109820713 isoform X2 n=1 Tax=Asparagus officinalis TaxID=4686 RepID=UPI00098E2FF0|nr:uncharacterized protein LOC109820713 isoform X2 [Asparagus officinalis]
MVAAPLTFSANLAPSRKILTLVPRSIEANHQSQQIKNPIQPTPKNPISFRCQARPLSSEAMADQDPVVPQQRMEIPNKQGEKLVGVLHSTGSKEVVVLCHGFRSKKEDKIILNLIGALTRRGISAFHFDFSGNGESEGTFEYGNYHKEVEDLHAVIQHLSKTQEVSAILGHSKAASYCAGRRNQCHCLYDHHRQWSKCVLLCIFIIIIIINKLVFHQNVSHLLSRGDVVLLYASIYHDVHSVINVSGRYDLKGGIEDRLGKEFMQQIKKDGFIDIKKKSGEVEYRVTKESLMDRLNTNMDAAARSIDRDCRVLTVHGSADEIIPVKDASEFAKLIPNHKLHIVEGADHGYSAHQVELVSVVLEFLKSNQVGDKA